MRGQIAEYRNGRAARWQTTSSGLSFAPGWRALRHTGVRAGTCFRATRQRPQVDSSPRSRRVEPGAVHQAADAPTGRPYSTTSRSPP